MKNIGQNNNFGGKKINTSKQPGIRLVYSDSGSWNQFRDENTGGGGIYFNEYIPSLGNYTSTVARLKFTQASNPNEWNDFFYGRHNRSTNCTFLDGHVENMRSAALGPHYMKEITFASGNNMLFP
ncbi:hypothetical protein SDC9_181433 [bioreactor metagenome]|uniref:Uncharacterized protein n=1 Tax=bioreactor metagenome TaxID=1076179 RepID=A0A645H4K1_9ZZZZ